VKKKKKKKLKRKDAGARVCFSPLWFLNLKKKKKKGYNHVSRSTCGLTRTPKPKTQILYFRVVFVSGSRVVSKIAKSILLMTYNLV